ncbi:MAG TPA: DsbA family protein [Geminicoccaceae bacterium]|nr:DsbA family protein [Geminicoccaceae bacterium]
MKQIALRLSGSLVAVLGLWTLVWLPLVLGESSAAEIEDRVLGDPNAPVTIIEYASLTCPHCAQFHEEVLPQLKERYIAPGKVRMIYRDFPLDQRALTAAALAHCAGPERYFGFLDVLFQTQESWARANDHLAALKRLGKLGGLSEAEMDACFADEELTNRILQTRLDGQNQHEISSTPTFVIDGKTYSGGRDIEEFGALIDPLLDGS